MDTYLTLAAPATAEFKDRNSRFLGFAYPVTTEEEALALLDGLRKEHFKANHHCFAWRLGRGDSARFRANDDGEPSGTAGRPILAQLDAAQLTDVFLVVVRYFGGTLLGASGLINAYRSTAAATLANAQIREVTLHDHFRLVVPYALLPDVTQAVHQLQIRLDNEQFGDETATLDLAIRQRDAQDKLLKMKALVLKISTEEAAVRDWPTGIVLEEI